MRAMNDSRFLTIICAALLFSTVFTLASGAKSKKSGKKSSEEEKMDKDQLRVTLGAARDSLVKYVSAPTFSFTSELIIDKIIQYLTEVETPDMKEVFEKMQTNPLLLKQLATKLVEDVDVNDDWTDPEKAYELMLSAIKTLSEIENLSEYFNSLVKILGKKSKHIITQKDEL